MGPLTRAGVPMARTSAGISPVTTDPAATNDRAPTVAPSSTVAWLPTSASSPIVAPCTTQAWPIVAPVPISVTMPFGECITDPSCTLAPARTTIGPKSPRRTTPYQTEAFSSTVTSPITEAVGATKAVGWTIGDFPSKEKSGMAPRLRMGHIRARDSLGGVGRDRGSAMTEQQHTQQPRARRAGVVRLVVVVL